jgi:hypothetical protein
MMPPAEATHVALLLRWLLGDPRADPDDLDWCVAWRTAQRERMLVRLADALAPLGEGVPEPMRGAVARSRARAERTVALAEQLSERLEREGVAHALLELAPRYPDVGRRLGLLVAVRAGAVDPVIRQAVGLEQRYSPHGHSLGGPLTYQSADRETTLDVHLGRLGERERYATLVLERRRVAELGGRSCAVPSPEDQILLDAAPGLWGRRALRLAHLLWTIATLRSADFDWGYTLHTARALGMKGDLGRYLQALRRIGAELSQPPFLPPERELLSPRQARVSPPSFAPWLPALTGTASRPAQGVEEGRP